MSTSRSPPAAPATTAANGPASPPARAPPGPNPAVWDGATPHLSPPSLPVPLTRGTPGGDRCQVRRRCRPGQVHGRTSVSGCHRSPPTPPPPPLRRPKSPPSPPCAAATSANLPCVIASSGRRWEGAGAEARGGGVRASSGPRARQPQAPAGRARAGSPPGPGAGPSSSRAPPSLLGHAPLPPVLRSAGRRL